MKRVKVMVPSKHVHHEEKEVTLPVYSRHDIDTEMHSTTWFRRIDENFVELAIKKPGCSCHEDEWELEVEKNDHLPATDYHLGIGEYESNAEEFNEVLAKFKKFLGDQLSPAVDD